MTDPRWHGQTWPDLSDSKASPLSRASRGQALGTKGQWLCTHSRVRPQVLPLQLNLQRCCVSLSHHRSATRETKPQTVGSHKGNCLVSHS